MSEWIPKVGEKDKAVIDVDEQREWVRRVRRCAEGMESAFSRRSAEAEAQRIEMFIAEVERLRAENESLRQAAPTPGRTPMGDER